MRIEVDSKAERVKTLSGFAQAAVALLDPTVGGSGYALQGGLHFFEPGSKELMHRGRPAEEGDGLDVFEPLRSATRLVVQPQRFLLIIEGIALRAKLEPSIDLLQPLVDLLQAVFVRLLKFCLLIHQVRSLLTEVIGLVHRREIRLLGCTQRVRFSNLGLDA